MSRFDSTLGTSNAFVKAVPASSLGPGSGMFAGLGRFCFLTCISRKILLSGTLRSVPSLDPSPLIPLPQRGEEDGKKGVALCQISRGEADKNQLSKGDDL